MLVTSLDLETSGLNPATDRITEVGAVLWDVERRKPVSFLSHLINPYGDSGPLRPETIKINGITDENCAKYGLDLGFVLQLLSHFLEDSAAILVHGGQGLDKPLLIKEYSERIGDFPNLPWVDTQIDFAYPEHMKMRALTYLAADHRYTLDFAHRGLFDSIAAMHIASYYDIPTAIELARHPVIKVQAGVEYKTKDEAKSRGYYYDNETRSWYKNLRACLLEQERSQCPFTVTPIA